MPSTQRNILVRQRTTAVALESTYASYVAGVVTAPVAGVSGPAWPNSLVYDVFRYDDIGIDGIEEAREDVLTESVSRVDPKLPYHGLRIGSTLSGLSKYCQGTPVASQKVAGWVPPTHSTAPAAGYTPAAGMFGLGVLLGAAMGGGAGVSDYGLTPKTFDQPGDVVAATPTPTVSVFSVTTGSLFVPGTWIAVAKATGGYDVAKVLSVATNAVTVYPALSAAPSTGAAVKNLYNYFPADSHGTGPGLTNNASVIVQHTFVDSAAGTADQLQVTLAGVYGDVEFTFGDGHETATAKFSGKFTDYLGPTEAASTIVPIVDTMGAIARFTPQVYVAGLNSAGGTSGSFPSPMVRGTTLVLEKLNIEVKGAYELIRDLNAPQTVAGVIDGAGRPRFGKCSMTIRMDPQAYADFASSADILYNVVVILPIGTGTSQSFWVWEISCASLVTTPKANKVGEYLYVDLEFNPLPDGAFPSTYSPVSVPTLDASPTQGMIDAGRAAFRVAFG